MVVSIVDDGAKKLWILLWIDDVRGRHVQSTRGSPGALKKKLIFKSCVTSMESDSGTSAAKFPFSFDPFPLVSRVGIIKFSNQVCPVSTAWLLVDPCEAASLFNMCVCVLIAVNLVLRVWWGVPQVLSGQMRRSSRLWSQRAERVALLQLHWGKGSKKCKEIRWIGERKEEANREGKTRALLLFEFEWLWSLWWWGAD